MKQRPGKYRHTSDVSADGTQNMFCASIQSIARTDAANIGTVRASGHFQRLFPSAQTLIHLAPLLFHLIQNETKPPGETCANDQRELHHKNST